MFAAFIDKTTVDGADLSMRPGYGRRHAQAVELNEIKWLSKLTRIRFLA